MGHKYFKLISICLILLVFLARTMPIAYASMDMDALQKKFANETGKQWSEVTSEERRDFMYKFRGHKKKEERKKRVEGVTAPFYIRESFKREKQMEWEDADKKKQKLYIQKYERLKRSRDRVEQNKQKDEKRRLMEIKREKIQKEKELKAKKLKKDQKKRAKQKKSKDVKKATKKRLKDAKAKKTKLQSRLKKMSGSR